jgi:hypothetical protein
MAKAACEVGDSESMSESGFVQDRLISSTIFTGRRKPMIVVTAPRHDLSVRWNSEERLHPCAGQHDQNAEFTFNQESSMGQHDLT